MARDTRDMVWLGSQHLKPGDKVQYKNSAESDAYGPMIYIRKYPPGTLYGDAGYLECVVDFDSVRAANVQFHPDELELDGFAA